MPKFTSLTQTKSSVPSSNAPRINVVTMAMFFAPALWGVGLTALTLNPLGIIIGVLLGLVAAQSPRVAKQWERAVVLRLGRYVGLRGPGLFWVIPFIDKISSYIDQRIITTNFAAEETLTAD